MTIQTIGKTGIPVNAMPLGAMYFGTKQDRDTAFAILDRYVERGGTFIDTANIYAHWTGDAAQGGESETMLGAWLRDRGHRDRLVIASKVGFGYPGVAEGLTAEQIRIECDKSLERMGIESIDVYFAHQDDWSVPQQAVLESFAELVDAGKIKTLGASNFLTHRLATANLIAAAQGLPRYEILQQRHTYLQPRHDADTRPQVVLTQEMRDYCRHADVSIMAYSATLGGAYSGEESRPVPEAYRTADNTARLAALAEVAEAVGARPQQVMLAYLMTQPNMLPMVAASSIAQLEENLAAGAITLGREQIARLAAAGA